MGGGARAAKLTKIELRAVDPLLNGSRQVPTRVAVIEREGTEPLGIALSSFEDAAGACVSDMNPGGLVGQTGAVAVDDRIIAVNGTLVEDADYEDIVALLSAPGRLELTVASNSADPDEALPVLPGSRADAADPLGERTVQIARSGNGYGMSVGDEGAHLCVQKVVPGHAAELAGLRVGDEILSVEDGGANGILVNAIKTFELDEGSATRKANKMLEVLSNSNRVTLTVKALQRSVRLVNATPLGIKISTVELEPDDGSPSFIEHIVQVSQETYHVHWLSKLLLLTYRSLRGRHGPFNVL